MGGGRERLLPRRRPRLRISRAGARDRRQDSRQGRQGRRLSVVRGRPQVERELRLPLDRQRRRRTGRKIKDRATRVGPFQSFEKGRKSSVSCACHWTVNVAAAKGHGRMSTDVYSVSPAGIFVPADSAVKTPADRGGGAL